MFRICFIWVPFERGRTSRILRRAPAGPSARILETIQAAFLRDFGLTLVLARAVVLDAAAARRVRAGASSSFAALRRDEALRAGSSSSPALAAAPLRRLRRSSSVRSRM